MYNYVMLMGTVKDIKDEFIVNQNIVHVTLACQRPFRNSEGEWPVDEFDITIPEVMADVVLENTSIGSKITVKGRLCPSNYKTLCKIIAERVFFMGEGKMYEVDSDGKKDC